MWDSGQLCVVYYKSHSVSSTVLNAINVKEYWLKNATRTGKMGETLYTLWTNEVFLADDVPLLWLLALNLKHTIEWNGMDHSPFPFCPWTYPVEREEVLEREQCLRPYAL